MKLSLAMIAKNEAAVIGHCLASVGSLADEIILVDTGSEDATIEIARRFGARISHFPWRDDFAAARNESLKFCTGDWVLILDADEAIDALDHSTIRQACQEERQSAYRLILRNYFPSGDRSTLDTPVQPNISKYNEGREYPYFADFRGLRLCKLSQDLRFEGRIHELLDPHFERRKLPIGELDAVIHHFGKLMEDREERKGRYYLELALQDAQKDPANFQFHFNVVQQGMMVGDWATVLQAAEAYMKLQSSVPTLILFGAALALQNLGRHTEALAQFDHLLRALPSHTFSLMRRALSLAALGRLDEARRSLRRAIQSQPGLALPILNLAEMESLHGQPQESRKVIAEGLALSPADPLLLNHLVKLDLAEQDLDRAAEDAWTALQRCPSGGQGLWHRLVALGLKKKGNTRLAQEILQLGLSAFPGDPELTRLRDVIGDGA